MPKMQYNNQQHISNALGSDSLLFATKFPTINSNIMSDSSIRCTPLANEYIKNYINYKLEWTIKSDQDLTMHGKHAKIKNKNLWHNKYNRKGMRKYDSLNFSNNKFTVYNNSEATSKNAKAKYLSKLNSKNNIKQSIWSDIQGWDVEDDSFVNHTDDIINQLM